MLSLAVLFENIFFWVEIEHAATLKATEKATGAGRLYIAKNRAGKDGIVFPIHIDTACSTIKVLDEDMSTLSEALEDEEKETKALIRKKWNELRSV